jgi:hypothetical protein
MIIKNEQRTGALASTLFIITTITALARWRNKDLFYTKSTKVLMLEHIL